MRIKLRSAMAVVLGVTSALIIAVAGSPADAEVVAGGTASQPAHAATKGGKKKAHEKKAHKNKKKAHKKKAHKKKAHKKKASQKGQAGETEQTAPVEKGSTQAIESGSEIPLAPAFTPGQLNAQPSGNFITPEGGTTGDHYSQLSEINPSNVGELKADWMTQLDGSGVGIQYSEEASPTEYKGVDYYGTGADDIFAVSVASGKILWVHKGELPSTTAIAVCCGWDNRGVAVGDGLVFSPVLNGYVEALSQKTGQLVWKTELGEPLEGFTVTSAPLYYRGEIFIGPVGAEYNTRGYMAAYNAKTGAIIWKHYNIPAPGEFGHNTWPTGQSENENTGNAEKGTPVNGGGGTNYTNEWEHGGATTWNAPTVAKGGLIEYSTANASGLSGDSGGWSRNGANLWSTSILALNYETGEMVWGYQAVHHDIWDYDLSVQPDMINTEVNGKMVESIEQTNKDGYEYDVNAQTGQPVFPTPEEEIPGNKEIQNDEELLFPTQPISPIATSNPQKPSGARLAEIEEALVKSAATNKVAVPKINMESGYHGNWTFGAIGVAGEPTIQGSSGGSSGAREAPASFDPKTGTMFVCSFLIASVKQEPVINLKGETVPGSPKTLTGGIAANNAEGYITAINMQTGKQVWQDVWPHQCYSGVMSTAAGIVFVGNEEGELLALEGATGKQLWSFETGASADAAASVYEFGGKERVAIMSGGNARSLSTSTHGDNLWQFSLSGTGPAPIPLGKTPPPPEQLPVTACANRGETGPNCQH